MNVLKEQIMFKDLEIAEVFEDTSNHNIYIKTEYFHSQEDNTLINAVNLKTGIGTYYTDEIFIRKLENAILRY